MKVCFRRKSKAPARAIPVPPGSQPRKRRRAAVAGFTGREGEVAEVSGRKRRLLLLGMGSARDFEAAGALAVARLFELEHVALDARGLAATEAASFAAGAVLRAWRFHRFLTRPLPAHIAPDRMRINRLDVLVDDPGAARAAWALAAAGVEGTIFARDLVAEPSNSLTPAAFASALRTLEQHGVEIELHGTEALEAQGFGALLAVGGGSANPPCLVVLRWPGSAGTRPVAFVGKGITFDTGGLNLKTAHGMWEMRADMAGAAACAGAILALARRRSPAGAVAVLPLAENMIDARSYRPSDVLRTYDGTTVEVVDTDAEGRLVLADALGFTVARLGPSAVIDLATLTGSIVTALGHHMAGLFATDDALAAHVAAAGADVGELAWRMPLDDEYGEALESDIADLRHCASGSRQPDACHAAVFLRRFVADVPWAHLDIAGVEAHETASDRHPAGPTGWGVRLLDRLVRDRFEDPHRV